MSIDPVYLLCKQIIIESDLLKCEFDDENTIIHCNQYDNPFEIKFTNEYSLIPDYKINYRFFVNTGYIDRLNLETPGLLRAQMNYMLAIIYKNLFNNNFKFNSGINEIYNDFGDGSGCSYDVEYYFFEGDERTYIDYELCERYDDAQNTRYIERQYMDLDCDDDEFIFDNETDILALLLE